MKEVPPNLLGRGRDHVHIARRRKLFCCNGQYLEILYNGTVKGCKNKLNPLIVMELIPAGQNKLRIMGVQTGFYLAIDGAGKVYATGEPNEETVFTENLSNEFYDSYTSLKYSHKSLSLGLANAEGGPAIAGSQHDMDDKKCDIRFTTKVTWYIRKYSNA